MKKVTILQIALAMMISSPVLSPLEAEASQYVLYEYKYNIKNNTKRVIRYTYRDSDREYTRTLQPGASTNWTTKSKSNSFRGSGQFDNGHGQMVSYGMHAKCWDTVRFMPKGRGIPCRYQFLEIQGVVQFFTNN